MKKKLRAKTLSNIIKIVTVIYGLVAYIFQVIHFERPLTSDEAKSIAIIIIVSWIIIAPIDASIIIKNIKNIKDDL